jgi:hypothetical protein
MGLLDDAIREHLELKRLGGADPGEVAREEQDALGSGRPRGDATQNAGEASENEVPSDSGESFSSHAESPSAVEPSKAGQETVEINMEAELSSTGTNSQPVAPRSNRTTPVAHPAHVQSSKEDPLEWEAPREPSSGRASSQADSDPKLDGDGEDGERIEDVLEETPDFLRDTPEQERLWFEQRPPRDFDFNE